MVNTYDDIFVAEWLTFHISRCRNSTTNTPRYRILASRTQMDLNHHQFVFPIKLCVHPMGWDKISTQQEEKLCVFLWYHQSQHDVCQPNRKPLSNLFGDTMAYHMYRGYGAVDRIRTYEAISDRFTVCCLYPS